MDNQYLIFMDNGLTDHDITIEDFKGSRDSLEQAIEFAKSLKEGARYSQSVAICRIDGGKFIIIHRMDV